MKDNMLITAKEFGKDIKDGSIGYILYIREVAKDSLPMEDPELSKLMDEFVDIFLMICLWDYLCIEELSTT